MELFMGRPAIDLTGKRFGNLVVLDRDGASDAGQAEWRVVCDCNPNRPYTVVGQSLREGRTTSCGKCRLSLLPKDNERSYEIFTWLRANGLEGGFVVAKDSRTGQVVAYTAQAKINQIGSLGAYAPVRAILQKLVADGCVPPRASDDSWDRYCKRNGIMLHRPSVATMPQTFDAMWQECIAHGPALPMAKAIVGRRAGDRGKVLFVRERVPPADVEPIPTRTKPDVA